MRMQRAVTAVTAALFTAASVAQAQVTTTSPAGGTVPSGVSVIGGIVTDLIGLNGNRLVAQLAASSLFVGSPPSSAYPLLIGTQAGFDATVLAALGGGISEAAFRFTLFDGDNAASNFDTNDNFLQVNGLEFSNNNWTNVSTVVTNSTGAVQSSTNGFPNNQLATGWFYTTEASFLSNLFTDLMATNSLAWRLRDLDPGDQFYDFTQGIDASLINVGTGPVVTPPGNTVPEPASMVLLASGLAGLAALRLRRRNNPEAV